MILVIISTYSKYEGINEDMNIDKHILERF